MFRSQQNRQRKRRKQEKQQPTTLLLIFFSFTLLLQPLCTHSTPIHTIRAQHDRGPCAHDSIAELIRTSPVILKALGAHIFSDDDFNGMGIANELNSYKTLDATATLTATPMTTSTTTTTTTTKTTTSSSSSTSVMQTRNDAKDNSPTMTLATLSTTSQEMESILITLTPETIYKGASLLKMSPGSENAAHSNRFFYANSAESATPFDGQLNATLQPAHCFESKLLQLLPTELIVFGKLITTQQQLQLLRPQEPQQLLHSIKSQGGDLLRVSINGFHRWSPQFENHIWKHLGWDDWSDFTLCSVTCGKGVQQRFRRCLLDNPMVNLNMNVNLNALDVDEVADDDNDDVDDVVDDVTSDDSILFESNQYMVDDNVAFVRNTDVNPLGTKSKITDSGFNDVKINSSVSETSKMEYDRNKLDSLSMNLKIASTTTAANISPTKAVVDELRHQQTVTLTRENNEHVQAPNVVNSLDGVGYGDDEEVMRIENMKTFHNENHDKQTQKLHKKRKASKTMKTLFCEGYNIEQRNCNTFECTDDINDLLKFYRRPMFEEVSMPLAPPISDATNKPDVVTPVAAISSAADASLNVNGSSLGNSTLSTIPANMGYIKSWHNSLNFTIMLTLRVKNDSRNTSTIFSIRNATHNLYLDQCQDGLRLYLERDNSTEMLPVKFNLYDNRWHQVAISVQNGDFISIYVDCSWTNSFVVSKRLFTLPMDADAEIGRGFNGELQQLLLLPENEERNQCSNRRTSINEVKRYIIDTFIGDYGN